MNLTNKTINKMEEQIEAVEEVITNDTETLDNATTETVVENNDIVRPILEELGLVDELGEFEEGLDLDTEEGIRQVITNTRISGYYSFLNQEIKSNPELYSLFLHYKQGGNIDSFKENNIRVLDDDSLSKDVSLQKQIVENDLLSKKVSKDMIDFIIQKTIDDEKLLEKAIEVNNNNKEVRESNIQEQEKERNEIEKGNQELQETLTSIVVDSLNNNKFSSLRVSQDIKKELFDSLSENIEINNRNAYYKVAINDSNIQAIIENHLLLIKPDYKTKLVKENASSDKIKSLKDKKIVTKGVSHTNNSIEDDETERIRHNLR